MLKPGFQIGNAEPIYTSRDMGCSNEMDLLRENQMVPEPETFHYLETYREIEQTSQPNVVLMHLDSPEPNECSADGPSRVIETSMISHSLELEDVENSSEDVHLPIQV